jgi:hypothetical protein
VPDQSYQLVVRKGPRPGQVFPLTLDTVTIGRDPLSDIVLNDPEVSRHHAKIVRSGDGYELQDMGSTNGSFVDGKRMGGDPVYLNPGHVVMLGSNVTLIYQATSASDPMATMIAPAGLPGLEEPEPMPEPEPEPMYEPEPMPEPEPLDEPEPEPEPVYEPEPEPMYEPEPMLESEPEVMTSPEMRIEEAFSEPEPMYEAEPEPMYEPEPMPKPPVVEEDIGMATVMESPAVIPPRPEPRPMPRYEEPEPLPAFDSGAPLPDFDERPASPPPPPMSGGGMAEKKGGMSRNTMIAIVAIIILCCCCLLIAAAVVVSQNPNLLAGADSTVPLFNVPLMISMWLP